ncbi:sodium:solute symporter [Aquirufa regiilacus]|uniref:Sodium:solute symporter n=1 Tax=Aquirufa regiilacus TaxID=3024868 RepID=A0ABU3TQ28_9BACT|nr:MULTISPECIES: sodium:solute symporter [unclassified Aquirufa]MDT8887359.1 sodium:solute symporter [Aquirufa sp. LEPPI-3A]MDU0807967.1 sodium:solute symporter [Aquirufa sp. LEOWEIH-7C]
MSVQLAGGILAIYFGLLLVISYITSRGADTNDFFTANRQSPWWLVAFGMIGTSISGLTFISVPGAVGKTYFTYYQVILGHSLGYLTIALVLMPLYYRLNLISIYGYLEKRFGFWAYKTGSAFFLLSRTIGSAARLYLAVNVLQIAIFEPIGVPFVLTVFISIALIWLYTHRGGVKTIIWTDTLQTLFLLVALFITIVLVGQQMHMGIGEMIETIQKSPYSHMFEWDWKNPHFFGKDFLAGVFIAIVMTGLDQDLMQKNLTCKSIGEAQKNMFWFYWVLLFINLLFLALGALLYIYAQANQIVIPAKTDELYPLLALGGNFGTLAAVTFLLGIIAASYASSDSALTALTTSFCIDFLRIEKFQEAKREKIKHRVHIGFSVLFFIVIGLFHVFNNQELIGAVFNLAGYTYGPLLGLFAFGLFTKTAIKDKYVPFVCVASPIITFILETQSQALFGGFGFAKLILNGAICYLLLWSIREKTKI